jgi:hypothetical protein
VAVALHASPLRAASTCAAVALAFGAVGCGGSSHTTVSAAKQAGPPPVCRPLAAVAVAAELGLSAGSVVHTAAVGNNGSPECHFRAVVAGQRVGVVVNVDGSPQPYARLERAIVEAGQQFGVVRAYAAPVTVSKLGLDASWFPDSHEVMTTDGTNLIAVTVSWPHVSQSRRRGLAEVAARAYLGKLNRKAAQQTEA